MENLVSVHIEDNNKVRELSRPERLSRILRLVASLTLISAAAVFLLQGLTAFDSTLRVVLFVVFTAVLAGTGLWCGLRLKDDKAARTALALTLLIVPVNFSQFGALIYSLYYRVTTGPQIFILKAGSALSVWIALALSLCLLLPIVYTGFAALARSRVVEFNKVFLLLNEILLVPTRETNLIGALCIAALILIFRTEAGNGVELRTVEGKLARLSLYLPVIILVGRSLVMYQADAIFISLLLGALGFILFSVMPNYLQNRRGSQYLQQLGAICFISSWETFANAAFFKGTMSAICSLGAESYLPVLVLPVAAILSLLSIFAISEAVLYRTLASIVAIVCAVLQLMIFGGIMASILIFALSLALTTLGVMRDEVGTTRIGLIGVCVALFYHMRYAMELYTFSPWLTLGSLGITILVASSLIEKHFGAVMGVTLIVRRKLGIIGDEK